VFEQEIYNLIAIYMRAYNNYLKHMDAIKLQQRAMQGLISPILISERQEGNENGLDETSLNREKIFKLETDLSVLLNYLIKRFSDKSEITKDGIAQNNLNEFLILRKKLRECAEGVLDLGFASSLLTQAARLNLNPFHSIFLEKTSEMKSLIGSGYAHCAINQLTVNKIVNKAVSTSNTLLFTRD